MTSRNRDRIFRAVNSTLMLLLCLTFIYPFLYTLALSLSDARFIIEGRVLLWPRGFNIHAYQAIFSDRSLVNSLLFTSALAFCGVIASMIATTLAAYPFPGRA